MRNENKHCNSVLLRVGEGKMRTSVVVCSYGGKEDLVEQCIGSLECQTCLPDEVILVVDTEEEKESYSNLLGKRSVPTRVICSGKIEKCLTPQVCLMKA